MLQFIHQHRVVYSETDKMGYVHHSNYARICENARWEALRSIGIVYSELEKANCWMPVVKFESTFRVPAFYDDLLSVEVLIETLPSASWTIQYRILKEEILINECTVRLAFFNPETQKAIRPPIVLLTALKPYFL